MREDTLADDNVSDQCIRGFNMNRAKRCDMVVCGETTDAAGFGIVTKSRLLCVAYFVFWL